MPSSSHAGKRWAVVAAASLVAAAVLVLGIMDASRGPSEDAQTRGDSTDGALLASRTLRVAEEPASRQEARSEPRVLEPPPGAKLPEGFDRSFMFPDREPDQHGNPIVTRGGQRVDPDTGWPYEIWLREPRLELVLVLPGEFTMGSTGTSEEMAQRHEGEADEYAPERPVHQVRITRPFYLAKYEITQSQWCGAMEKRPWEGKEYVREALDHPAVWVNWHDCWELARKLNDKAQADASEGFVPVFRLPTEAEWEYACRAGSTTTFCFGDETEKLKDHAWSGPNAGDVGQAYAHGVGRKKPNAWGLHDLHGNVLEWCRDWRSEYGSDAQTDPSGPAHGAERVLRGGSYLWPSRGCRSAARFYSDPSAHRFPSTVGARVALSVEKPGAPRVAEGAGLPRSLMIPVSDLDQYGNAVVTRHTRRVDPETGWPYEIWLKEPRLELVLVPAGELTMGCSFTPEEMIQRYEGEAKDYEPERPAHPVRITRSFYLGKYEVTRSQWSHVMGSQPWVGGKYVRENPLHPAVCINWFDWREFMKKLGAIATDEAQLKAGKDLAAVFRYPTEAEWEYACRAGSTAAFCFGDDVEKLKDYAWCKRNAWDVGRGYTHPVGRRKPNA